MKPLRVEGWGPWRRSYEAASKDAERLCKKHVKNYRVVCEVVRDRPRYDYYWCAAQLPKAKTK